jgi:hypothetical protein
MSSLNHFCVGMSRHTGSIHETNKINWGSYTLQKFLCFSTPRCPQEEWKRVSERKSQYVTNNSKE